MNKGNKLHNLYQSFNIIIRGKVRNNDSGNIHGQYEILADFPIQTNLLLKESQDIFMNEEKKFLDRLNIEALEDTVFMRINSTHIT